MHYNVLLAIISTVICHAKRNTNTIKPIFNSTLQQDTPVR